MRARNRIKRRNLAAAHNPLLAKGGVHRPSKKRARQQAKRHLRRECAGDAWVFQAALH